MNLLESAGFSRANPYYVVQQGKVPAHCNACEPYGRSAIQQASLFVQRQCHHGTAAQQQAKSDWPMTVALCRLRR
jgi:hypothetical protein